MRKNRKGFETDDQMNIFDKFIDDPAEKNGFELAKEDFREKLMYLLTELKLKHEFVIEEEWHKEICYIIDENLKKEKFEARIYILDIVFSCLRENSLVYIDTGLGKTYIAIFVSILILRKNPKKKVLLMAPTKVLCSQHYNKINEICIGIKAGLITGSTSQKKRLTIWNESNIIIATPETMLSELNKSKQEFGVANPYDMALIVLDEAHNLRGKYAYAELIKFYHEFGDENQIRFLGFTASPDSKVNKLEELRRAFKISYTGIIAKCYESDDVAPYTFEKKITPIFIEKDTSILEENIKHQLSRATALIIKKMISISKSPGIDECEFYTILEEMAYKDTNNLIAGITIEKFKELDRKLKKYCEDFPGDQRIYMLQKNWGVLGLLNASFSSLKKGVSEFRDFLQRKYRENLILREKILLNKKNNSKKKIKKKPSLYEFITNTEIERSIIEFAWNNLWQEDLPENFIRGNINWSEINKDLKLQKLEYLISHQTGQMIIFTPYRDTLKRVIHYIRQKRPNKRAEGLFGQSHKLKDPGMSQKEQETVLSEFKSGKIDVLVSTSVGEQGLDFPYVDTVVLFEPVSDIRRCIQMIGRTGRSRRGDVFILIYNEKSEKIRYYIFRNRKKIVQRHIENYRKFAKEYDELRAT